MRFFTFSGIQVYLSCFFESDGFEADIKGVSVVVTHTYRTENTPIHADILLYFCATLFPYDICIR